MLVVERALGSVVGRVVVALLEGLGGWRWPAH